MRRPLAALLLLMPLSCRGEVILKEIRWELAQNGTRPGRPRKFDPIERWSQPPTARLARKPRAVITLANRGPKAAEGVLVRYAVSARLMRTDRSSPEGVWAVPFHVEERRVPRVKANELRRVPIDSLLLATHLKRMHLAGLWPDALKIQVMVDPRPGDTLEGKLLENLLPVSWDSPSGP